ncbi:hyaluronan-binding protein 2-like isoform X1 [Amblyraja radiata]|uniref:hyaluronan-binding protein 2-like isoform X1 n=1 Tax=Amblyraja radiata TaxID=386614 RepID=UPI001403F51F|nr:hyaluronan-binding protein 2-like isoform X1 [Amblyraja radiata]
MPKGIVWLMTRCLYIWLVASSLSKAYSDYGRPSRSRSARFHSTSVGSEVSEESFVVSADSATGDDHTGTDDDGYPSWMEYSHNNNDPCLSNPCQNQGICETTASGFTCRCPRPFIGKRCQNVNDPCKKNMCKNGECIIQSNPPYYKCKCKHPYVLPTCKKATAPCNPNPCKHGATCKTGKKKSFTCNCPGSFRGELCEIAPNECYQANGVSYRGRVKQTEQGKKCLHWSSNLLLKEAIGTHMQTPSKYGIGDHNYCRNPDGDEKPWCYFKEKNNKLNWDHCNISQCAAAAGTQPHRPATTRPAPRSTTAPSTAVPFQCGVPEVGNVTFKIFGGKRTVPGKYPWQVSLQLKNRVGLYKPGHLCGGALIKPCWVLTAAHCIFSQAQPKDFRLQLGKQDLQRDETHQQIFDVENIIVHDNYQETSVGLYNDIALLKIKQVNGHCAKETKYVKTVCMPDSDFQPGTDCHISGWGQTETEAASNQLLHTKVKLISDQHCKDPRAYGNAINHTMFCAGSLDGSVDSCQGDSGGPLTCMKNGRHQVYGIVSWGDRCGVKYKPGVYVRLTAFLKWIKARAT